MLLNYKFSFIIVQCFKLLPDSGKVLDFPHPDLFGDFLEIYVRVENEKFSVNSATSFSF